ncbi:unnamed protein product [Gongylonema pulchrum]|uniref:Uncharacterized protein n=1 Tax=Gongylonema pulchrum TaxID=637853 RepID=A0A183DZZ3_9BILA|nr:unnamed protein product [Gongylonema pulchrum]
MSGDDGGGPSKKRRIDKELTRMLRLREELQAPDQEPESQRTEEQQQQPQQTTTRRRLRHRLPEQQRWHPSNFAELSLVTGSENISELDEDELEERLCCCLATRVGNNYQACMRPAFGIYFSHQLRCKAMEKRLPFRGHWYVCLFHYRIVMNEQPLKPEESLESRDLSKHLAKEVTSEEMEAYMNDPVTKVICNFNDFLKFKIFCLLFAP